MHFDEFGEQTSQNEIRDGDEVHSRKGIREPFVVPGQTAEPAQPGEAPFDGLITNDKFCLTRGVRLVRPVRRAR